MRLNSSGKAFSILLLGFIGAEIALAQPKAFLLDAAALVKVKRYVNEKKEPYKSASDALRQEAEKALAAGPFSVINKTAPPPSGDKHDYYSFGTYWWPDPTKPDGLPYP